MCGCLEAAEHLLLGQAGELRGCIEILPGPYTQGSLEGTVALSRLIDVLAEQASRTGGQAESLCGILASRIHIMHHPE